jgi:hypothetical protein
LQHSNAQAAINAFRGARREDIGKQKEEKIEGRDVEEE